MCVKDGQEAVLDMRWRNQDVFRMPSIQENILYVYEELSEFNRVAQVFYAPDHIRSHKINMPYDKKKLLEFGQILMMLFSLSLQMDIDPDLALRTAIEHTDAKCDKARRALGLLADNKVEDTEKVGANEG